MRQSIQMEEIPFAPLLGERSAKPQLADTIPPTRDPPAPLPTKRPRAHFVVAWRNDGGLDSTRHETVESAHEFAHALHWVVYYKFAIQCGAETVASGHIAEPADMGDAWARYCAAAGR